MEEKLWGWALKLNKEGKEEVLRDLLKTAHDDNDLRNAICHAFHGPMILITRPDSRKKVFIALQDRTTVEASIGL